MKKRPLSPHLSVYRPQISSALSIAHRLTGIALFVGVIFLNWLLAAIVFYPEVLETDLLYSFVVKIILFGWTLSLFYHTLNGIRHLFWDAGIGFSIRSMNYSGIFVVICSIVLSATCWWIALKSF